MIDQANALVLARSALEEREQRVRELEEALRAFMALDKSFSTICDRHLNEMADEGQAMAKAVRLARSVLNKENGNG